MSQDVVSTTTIRAITASAPVPPPRRKKLVYSWVQDASASMAGSRTEAALDGFDYMFQEVFHPTDFLSAMTFNSDFHTLHLPMPVHKVNAARDKASIRQDVGGRTRMYDAVGSAIEALQKLNRDPKFSLITNEAVYELLVLTDGADNCSTDYDHRRVAELIAHPGLPNFHLVVVAVSMSECDKQNLHALCNPDHATFLDVASLSELQRTLHGVGERVQQRLVYTTTTTTTRVVSSSASSRGHANTGESIQAVTMSMAKAHIGHSKSRLLLQGGPRGDGAKRGGTGKLAGVGVCSHFQAGNCRFGSKCRNLHV